MKESGAMTHHQHAVRTMAVITGLWMSLVLTAHSAPAGGHGANPGRGAPGVGAPARGGGDAFRGGAVGAGARAGDGGGARYRGAGGAGGAIGLGLGLGFFTGALIGSEMAATYPYYYPLQAQPPVIYTQPLIQMPLQPLAPSQSSIPAQATWYFCETSQSYYPYVSTCSVPWRMVSAYPPVPTPILGIQQ